MGNPRYVLSASIPAEVADVILIERRCTEEVVIASETHSASISADRVGDLYSSSEDRNISDSRRILRIKSPVEKIAGTNPCTVAPGDEGWGVKKGVLHPRTPEQWSATNAYLHHQFSEYLSPGFKFDIDTHIGKIQDCVYNHFASTYGFVDKTGGGGKVSFGGMYDNMSVKELKNALKSLKTHISPCSRMPEISFVSRLIRTRLKVKKLNADAARDIDQDLMCRRHFWKFVKKVFKNVNSSLPTFNVSTCYSFFSKTLSLVSPGPFPVPTWIPPSNPPPVPISPLPPAAK